MKKIISLILVLAIFTTGVIAAAAAPIPDYNHECVTDCKGDCEYSPLIVVPGIMQSQVYIQDGNGNDLKTSEGFPILEGMDMKFMFDMNAIYEKLPVLVAMLLMSVITGDRDIFIDKFVSIFSESFASHYFDNDGNRISQTAVDEYWYSYEVAKTIPDKSYGYVQGYEKDENGNTLPSTKYPTQFDLIKSKVDITEYCELAGYDHVYYYAYSSFGDSIEAAERLNDYIKMVKEQTGHDKVNIVFISLGGTIGNAYLAKYCNPDDIDRIVFAAGATDGSYFLSDIMDVCLSLDNSEFLYSEMIPLFMSLLGKDALWMGYLFNFITRCVPNDLFSNQVDYVLARVVKDVLGNLLYNCPSMWSLVPSGEYERLAEKFISDDAHKGLKAKTDEYYEIQKNAAKTVQQRTAEGMEIFVICGYNLALPSVLGHWKENSDNIIQVESTSIGATAAPYGEKLPDSYIPAIDESYISPDGTIDAGTAALPDRTWFIRNQSHLELAKSIDDVISLCVAIIKDDTIQDARVENDGYPQFNNCREIWRLNEVIDKYEEVPKEKIEALDEKSRDSLNEAYDYAVGTKECREWDFGTAKFAESLLYTELYKNGLIEGESPLKRYALNAVLNPLFKLASDVMLALYGPRDYYTRYF